MIILDSVNKSIEVELPGAVTTNQLTFMTSYVDMATINFAIAGAGSTDGVTADATPVTAVPAPGAETVRQVKHMVVHNLDTTNQTVKISLNNNGTTRELVGVTLSAGESLEYSTDGFRIVAA